MTSETEVVEFLHMFERLAAKRDFGLLVPYVHEHAVFRFNDGDFRGIENVRKAFEKTWETTSKAVDDKFYLSDIEVLTTDSHSAGATYTYNWEGRFDDFFAS